MRKNKGISLIVLIITIIVIIILATAILVSVISNNPITEANKARYESDRDNMQAVFTNTVGKIMAENQGIVNVTAGQINTETADVTETTGEVAYTVDNAANEANASGTIVFDKDTNTATTYYTGKKLPIYAAGETKWYVDADGVMSVEVAGVKYGSGEELEDILEPGLYNESGNMTMSWQELVDGGYLIIDNGTLYSDTECDCSGYGGNGSIKEIEGKLVIDRGITAIGNKCFGCDYDVSVKLTEIIVPDSVISIGHYAFSIYSLKCIELPKSITNVGDAFTYCGNLSQIKYNGTIDDWNNSIFSSNLYWHMGCPEITVHCTDGDIIIPAS